MNLYDQLKDKQWYHQGFDGTPMFILAIAEAEQKSEKRKPKAAEVGIRVCFFKEGRADWYLDIGDVKKGVKDMLRLAKKDPKISVKLLKYWEKDEKAYEQFFWKKFPKIKLKKLTDKELLKLWHKYWSLFIDRSTSTGIIDHFALGTDEIISQMLKKEIEKTGNRFIKPSEFSGIFSIATAPVHQSFINKAQIDLLKIILKKSRQNLSDYQKKYFWSKNNYTIAQQLSVADFEKEIKAWKQSGSDLNQELKRIQNTPKINKQRKQKLFKTYKLSPLLRTLLKISEDFTWWQDERKKATYYHIDMGSKILSEIGKRSGYSPQDLKYAVSKEIDSIVNFKKPGKKELQARKKNSVCLFTKSDLIFVFNSTEVNKIRKTMLAGFNKNSLADIRGLSASTGRAIGRAKIVKSATEINKVNRGDILIAVMTRPDYIAGMKKAAAIVTNEGGITSHAAIVSRELGIPCIIGTKIATEIFKDGDTVEVNANHGWVRKIK